MRKQERPEKAVRDSACSSPGLCPAQGLTSLNRPQEAEEHRGVSCLVVGVKSTVESKTVAPTGKVT